MASSSSSSGTMASSSSSSGTKNGRHRKPRNTRFWQQQLPAWRPVLTPLWIIAIFISIGAICIPIGLVSLSASRSVVEVAKRYDDICIPPNYRNNSVGFIKNPEISKTCEINITVPKNMTAPIFIYYQLHKFHQNHRRYVNSRSFKQSHSSKYEKDPSVDKCEPEAYVRTNDSERIVPCGLIAWSLFNDTYKIFVKDEAIEINKSGIAWESDKQIFGSKVYPKNFQTGDLIGGGNLSTTVPLNQQEDLLVWMRTAPLPIFRKLYGKIHTNLPANETVYVVIENNYNTYSFGGKKMIIFSTTTWIGGRNDVVGIAYIALGVLHLLYGIIFTIKYLLHPRPIGDPSYLSWNRDSPARR